MAKRKNSTALFEVIHAGKFDRKAEGDGRPDRGLVAAALKTPRWWFKGGGKEEAPPAALDPNDPTANITASTLFQSRQRAPDPAAAPAPAIDPAPAAVPAAASTAVVAESAAPAVPEPVSPAADSPDPSVIPVTVRIDPAPAAPTAPAARAATTALVLARDRRPEPKPLGGRMGMKVAFDGDRQELTLRMRYTAALVTGFTVLVIIGLAYVVGRRMSHGPATAEGGEAPPSTAQLKKGPPQPTALDVTPRSGRPAVANGATARTPGSIGPTNGAFLDAPTDAAGTAQRTMNLNYLLILSFPPERRQAAYDARDWFNVNAHIPCTVEKDSARLRIAKGWYGVVGTRGFPPGLNSSPEYRNYVDVLQAAVNKYPDRAKVDKRPPVAFKWVE